MTVKAQNAYVTLYKKNDAPFKIGMFTELTKLDNKIFSETNQQIKNGVGYNLDSIKLYKDMYSDSVIAQKVWKNEEGKELLDTYSPVIDSVETITKFFSYLDNEAELKSLVSGVLSKVNSAYDITAGLKNASELTDSEELTDSDSLNLMEDYIASHNFKDEVAQECYAQINELRNQLNLNKRVK